MSEAQRKTYTPAFKAKVSLEAIRGVKTVNEIGQDHGVHPAQVGQWQREIQEQAQTLFENRRGPKPVDGPGEPDRLYGEIGRRWRLRSLSKSGAPPPSRRSAASADYSACWSQYDVDVKPKCVFTSSSWLFSQKRS